MSTILVIDDEKGILQLIYHALTKFGHKVETAVNGQEGIEKFDGGDMSLGLSYARGLTDRLSVGATVKYIESNLGLLKMVFPVIDGFMNFVGFGTLFDLLGDFVVVSSLSDPMF